MKYMNHCNHSNHSFASPKNILVLLVGLLLLLLAPGHAEAGIYNNSNEVTYKEYWINHSQFTGGCHEDGSPTAPNGSFYIEPWRLDRCPKTMSFNIPDDFSSAAKIEIYIDLWRNYSIQAARFRLNDSPTIHAPKVGNQWSRTPWVGEVDKSELKQGNNTITFWGEQRFHAHDVAFRIYYNAANPLSAGPGSDVVPPNGQLLTISDDNGPVAADAGGTLMANNDKLTLKANVSGAKFVEFHAFYEGYDEDNDGNFLDWHNLGRNDWHPGGRSPDPLGGTINHIGTVAVTNGEASITWDIPHITNQALIKFKIRVVDENGNVREAAGGESADFKLLRNRPVLAYLVPNFADAGLWMDGSRSETVEYTFSLPANKGDFNSAFLIGNYWRRPRVEINSNAAGFVTGAPDEWMLQVKSINAAWLLAGTNKIRFSYTGGFGHFIEYPGPMFILRRTTAMADNTPPTVSNRTPAPGATNVDEKSGITVRISDSLFGVDFKTIKMTVNGQNVTSNVKRSGLSSDYLLSYVPPQPFDFGSVVNVELEACDLAGNCMNKVSYSFTIEERETIPPVISNIQLTTRPDGARLTWKTDEPATSLVEFGKTDSYELGQVSSDELVTNHELEFRGLSPDTSYHYRIRSADELGNEAQSADATFTTDIYSDLYSTDFNSCELDDLLWEFIDPLGDATVTVNGQQLELSVPGGVSHHFPNPSTNNTPRLMQRIANKNFSLEVKFDSAVSQPIETQGVLIEDDENNYVRFFFEYTKAGEVKAFAVYVKNGTQVKNQNKVVSATPTAPLYLRVQRTGNTWSWQFSTNGTNYTNGGNQSHAISVLKAGVFVGNSPNSTTTDQPSHTAVVDYFFNANDPIVPEDAQTFSITTAVDGNGTVTADPQKSNYACGEEVVLTATGDPGWSFESWSGSIITTTNPLAFAVDGSEQFTATFIPAEYVLNVEIITNGDISADNKVELDPDQPTYHYGDTVKLTAVPDPRPDWRFVGWGGAISGSELVNTITITEDTTVTATFEQEFYTIDVTINGGSGEGGGVTIEPQQTIYALGEEVTLTAEPDPGWSFSGWSGNASGNEPTITFFVTGDMVIDAAFEEEQYLLQVDVVSEGAIPNAGEGGSVSVSPQPGPYGYGDTVTLTAVANPGWTFSGWSGALSGSQTTRTLTMTADTQVVATFTQDKYSVNVTTEGDGFVTIAPQRAFYVYGEQVTLTANPVDGYFFGGWQGDLLSADNPATYTVVGDAQITAVFTDNAPPAVEPIPDRTIGINQMVTFVVTASDPDGTIPSLTTAEDLPAGASFTDNGDGTGSFRWIPGMADRGTHTITFIAQDSEGIGLGSQTVTITVEGYGVALPFATGP